MSSPGWLAVGCGVCILSLPATTWSVFPWYFSMKGWQMISLSLMARCSDGCSFSLPTKNRPSANRLSTLTGHCTVNAHVSNWGPVMPPGTPSQMYLWTHRTWLGTSSFSLSSFHAVGNLLLSTRSPKLDGHLKTIPLWSAIVPMWASASVFCFPNQITRNWSSGSCSSLATLGDT